MTTFIDERLRQPALGPNVNPPSKTSGYLNTATKREGASHSRTMIHQPLAQQLTHQEDLTEHEQQQLSQYIKAGTADNTRKAYQSSINHFVKWGGKLPTTPTTLIKYLLAHAGDNAFSTLSLRLSALSKWHQLQGFEDPTTHTSIRKALVGIQRMHPKTKLKAKALSLSQLMEAGEVLRAKGTASSLRDTALLFIGFFGALRRSELASIQFEHIEWHTEGLLLTLPRSKTDQEGKQIIKAIPYGETIESCPVNHLSLWKTYLDQNGIATLAGPVFCQINRWGHISSKAITDHSVNAIIKKVAIDCNWPHPERYSGHSLRRGFSTSAAQAGASFNSIKRQGGWSDDRTVHGYIDEGNAFNNHAAQALFKEHKKNRRL